jgi:flagellar hook-associated protein 2
VSTITTGVGLVSGLDYKTIIEQLMKVEARPRDRLLTRISTLDAQKAAYLEISARITALLSRVEVLSRSSSFRGATATSSAPSVLSASARAGARPGTYQFTVRALATTHQLVSRGFNSATAAVPAGTLTIESGLARVNRATALAQLNGGRGVQLGSIRITNAAGQQATVNLVDARTVADVVARINAAGIAVTATVRDDALVLRDDSGGSGALRVEEVSGGRTAEDLGFGAGHNYSTTGELVGTALLYMIGSTGLAALNDGLGVRRSVAGGDFSIRVGSASIAVDLSDVLKPETRLERLNHAAGVRLGRIRITSRDGTMREVDLSGAKTIQDVQRLMQEAFDDGRISVTLNGPRLLVSDRTTVPSGQTARNFEITDVTGYAALDLGLTTTASGGSITGRNILLVDTVADVLAAINYASGNADTDGNPLVAAGLSPNGRRIVLNSSTPGEAITLEPGSSSAALADLGFEAGVYGDAVESRRLVGGIDTVLLRTLNGGRGAGSGTIRIDANGATADVDLAGAETLADVIQRINDAAAAANLRVRAGYDSTGTRLVVAHDRGGAGAITISDVGEGTFAQSIGLAQAVTTVRSANLQRQYVAETTRLADLNNGRGVAAGTIRITNALGGFSTLTVSASQTVTLGDLIRQINDLNLGVQARINDTGDGLLITDTTGGAGQLKIEDVQGTAGRDLNIARSAANGQIDGSLEFRITLTGSETLESLATRIGAESTLAEATLLNDGSATSPYRLSITARRSGLAGELIVDNGDTGLGLATLTEAQDARLLFGGNVSSGVLLTSSSNTFTNVLDGLDLTVTGTSDSPVTVTVTRNLQTLIDTLSGLVSDVNTALGKIKEATAYNQEKKTKGVLFGESTAGTVQSRLLRLFTRTFAVTGTGLTRLSQVGIGIGTGSELTFDSDRFRAAYEADPDGVTAFFSAASGGVGPTLKTELSQITGTTGLLTSRTRTLDEQKESLQQRVDQLNTLLDRKRERLTRQFQALESVLAQLQSQQSTLANFASAMSYLFNSSTSK